MTLDKAIKHCEEVAEEQDMKAGFETDYQTYTMSETERERCRECANEHRQLAEWLKELKSYKEQQPSEPRTNLAETSQDCIGREAVIKGLANIAKAKAKSDAQKSMMGRCMFFVEHLPPVTPKYTDEEIDRAQAVEQAYIDKMVELTVEELKRPKGKWIEIEIDAGEFIYKCTKCGMRVINPYKYCPNCGSYNGGEEDETND